EGAKHRERADAEDQAGRDEGQADAPRFAAAAHPALRPGADRLHAVVEPEQLTDQDAKQDADQQDQRIVRFERHLDADHGDEKTDCGADGPLETFGDNASEGQADRRAGDDGPDVERGAETRNHVLSPTTFVADTGRLKPFSVTSRAGSTSTRSSTAAYSRWLIRISPPF